MKLHVSPLFPFNIPKHALAMLMYLNSVVFAIQVKYLLNINSQFFNFQHIVFAVKFIIALVIPDVPSHVKIAESRVCKNYQRKGNGEGV